MSPDTDQLRSFPATRYQGSKYKLLPWISSILAEQSFGYGSVLDAFSGTGAVSYLFKTLGKQVHSNDALRCNQWVATALIENDHVLLDDDDIEALLAPRDDVVYDDWIARTFGDIYFTDEENEWLDRVVQHVHRLPCRYKQAMAWWALFQAALSKRPYNLFHRKNLYVRTAKVERTFGNKATWDRPFEDHFRRFVGQANAAVFGNGQRHATSQMEARALPTGFDLVYLDPPYIPAKGSLTRYRDFYHFLEGMVMYDSWPSLIDESSKHRKLRSQPSPWEQRDAITDAFRELFARFRDATLVVSYRLDGVPSIPTLQAMMAEWKDHVTVHTIDYQYALSKRQSKEVLLIGV